MTAIRDVVQPPIAQRRSKDLAARVIADRAEGEAYVASVCFKHGPPRQVGVELEYTVHHRDDPCRHLDPAELAKALGVHAPQTLFANSPALPLPDGSSLTIEPGGQVEISTQPHHTLPALFEAAERDRAHVAALLAACDLTLGESASDPYRPPVRLLDTARYAAMERRFAPHGPDGVTMMCATAALQVCVDTGDHALLPKRWAALHALGPALIALFANSSRLAGVDTGAASSRWLAVMGTEPSRTAPPDDGDPITRWSERVMDTPLLVLRRDRGDWDAPPRLTFAEWISGSGHATRLSRPTFGDLDYHLTTMFTPVRPRGYLEVRYLDAQPGEDWRLPVALLSALLEEPGTVDSVLEHCEPTAGRWAAAARSGLGDRALRTSARRVVELGIGAIGRLGLSEATVAMVVAGLERRLEGRR